MHKRFATVREYIDEHLADHLTLDTLSGIAHYSKFHFHRQFGALFGMSVHRYVLLSRMKRGDTCRPLRPSAAHRLRRSSRTVGALAVR